jgi:hypothetical protein
MSVENGMFIRSRPVYQPLAFDAKGRFNLLVGFGAGASALEDMVKNANDQLKVEDTIVLISGSETEQYDAKLFFSEKRYQRVEYFESSDALMNALAELLETMKMGLRLYIAGPERIIWQAVKLASDKGMVEDEIAVEARGSFARRVTCSHCATMAEPVTTNIFDCEGCGQTLVVNDHFSRRLAAYMGFRADAETPGNLPEKVELYR